jgi:hypothetical protein
MGAHEISHIFQVQFAEHGYILRRVRFLITEVRLGRQDFHDEIRTGRSPLDDLDAYILTVFNKSHFESTHSIADTLRVADLTMFLRSHDFIDFRSFHLH